MNKVEDLINIMEDKSKEHKVNELIGICKRINNSKRDFLFVNNYQGKHIPQNPSKIIKMFEEFVSNIKENDEKILVIGFAETATAIGRYVADRLPNCVYEMQTTREKIEGQNPILEFKEEHSHATEQLLYGDKNIFNKVKKVLFVEDEITTGNTIINFIKEINKINSNLKYAVASILNWQDEEHIKIFQDYNIETYYLVKGLIKDVNAKVNIKTEEDADKKDENASLINCNYVKSELCNLQYNRCGRVPIKDLEFYGSYIFDKILNGSKLLKEVCKEENKKILVIGTEEFMYEPLIFANYLEKNTTNNVFYYATTRSPIAVSKEDGYTLKQRNKFRSCYDKNRTTYLYNIGKYDNIFIITDSKVSDEFAHDFANILNNYGYDLKNVEIISLY